MSNVNGDNETAHTENTNATADAVLENDAPRPGEERPFLETLADLGAEWAALGISFGAQALDRSARSLKLASKTLALVSRKLEESRPRPARDEAQSPMG